MMTWGAGWGVCGRGHRRQHWSRNGGTEGAADIYMSVRSELFFGGGAISS